MSRPLRLEHPDVLYHITLRGALPIRIAAVAIAFGAYFLFKRRLVAGVLAGGLSLSALVALLG